MLLFFLCPVFSFGQWWSKSVETLTMNYIKDLSKDVDTICIYFSHYVGSIHISNDSFPYSRPYIPVYMFWLKHGETYLTKIDIYYEYSVIKLNRPSFWSFFFENEGTIKNEKMKMFELHSDEPGVIRFNMIDHSMHRYYRMIVNGDETSMDIDEYHLEKGDKRDENINYSHNQGLKSKKLIYELSEIAERDSSIRRVRRK